MVPLLFLFFFLHPWSISNYVLFSISSEVLGYILAGFKFYKLKYDRSG